MVGKAVDTLPIGEASGLFCARTVDKYGKLKTWRLYQVGNDNPYIYIYRIYPVILEYRIEILASQGIPIIELENSYLEYSWR